MLRRQSDSRMKRRGAGVLAFGIFLFGMSGGAAGLAQEKADDNRINGAFLSRFGRDITGVITSPARWDRGDLLTLAAVSGTGLLLMAFDQEIRDQVQERRTASSDKAASVFTAFGNGAALLGLSAALYAAGEIGHDDGLRKTALLSLESLTMASLLVWMTKFLAGRARPYSGESSGSFHPFALESEHWSLPSGHSAAAFSVATTIAMQSRSVLVDIAAYTMACLVGISRVHDNKHWASDVFLGSVLGYFVSREIVRLNRPEAKKTLSVGLYYSGGRQALTLSLTF